MKAVSPRRRSKRRIDSSAPTAAPSRIASRDDLRRFQRLVAHAVMRPLGRDDTLAPRWDDGRRTADIVGGIIKPNDRLSSVERLEIYARCYWYRITASMYDDCPGLRALLGERRFAALVRAYLVQCPSQSFTLRHLCRRLPEFVRRHPSLSAPHSALAESIARFEWAQTQAFDAAALPPIAAATIAQTPAHLLRLKLQPHLTLLDCAGPVDDYVIAVKRREAQGAIASNAPAEQAFGAPDRRVRRPRRERTYLVVHRYKNRLFYKRESAASFALLSALARGHTLAQAVAAAGSRVSANDIQTWFSTWMELGWFCAPAPRPHSASRSRAKTGATHSP